MKIFHSKPEHLPEIAALFFKLGWVAFGGPAAHIAMMETEIVEKRKWMSRQEFLDLMGVTTLIPGPNSTELAIHCGYTRGGFLGLLTAGICFIFPAVFLTIVLAYFYTQSKDLAAATPILQGIQVAVLVIIFSAILKLGKKALKSNLLYFIAGLVVVFGVMDFSAIACILGGGVLGMLVLKMTTSPNINSFFPLPLIFGTPFLFTQVTSENSPTLGKLFFVFLKVGAILFGSGYVLVAYLETELIDNLGWLTQSQLLDAIAIGQFTPGPVLSASAFVGYQIFGLKGAILAALGIFLPSFFYVFILNPFIPKMRKSAWLSAFLDAVNASAVAMMAVILFKLAQSYLIYEFLDAFYIDWRNLGILSVIVFLFYFLKNTNPFLVVGVGAFMGWFFSIF